MIHGVGHKFTLTELRRNTIVQLLRKQHTLSSIHALKFSSVCSYNTLVNHCSGVINIRHEQQIGLVGLKCATFDLLDSIDDSKDRVNANLKYLERYELDDEPDVVATQDVDVAAQILDELNG